MSRNLYIVTGGSHGLGKAVVMELLDRNQKVLSLSRTPLPKKNNLQQIKIDFSKPFQSRLQTQLKKIKNFDHIYLINNAGVIEPIGRIESLKEKEIIQHLKINLIAPIIMTQLCLKIFGNKNRVIVQITSGAATRPIEGWSVYAAGKAGLNMFNQILALQMQSETSFKCIGYSPGVMDTRMQAQIRKASIQQFPDVKEFKKYQKEKTLRSPKRVSQDLLKLLETPEKLVSGEVYRVSF